MCIGVAQTIFTSHMGDFVRYDECHDLAVILALGLEGTFVSSIILAISYRMIVTFLKKQIEKAMAACLLHRLLSYVQFSAVLGPTLEGVL